MSVVACIVMLRETRKVVEDYVLYKICRYIDSEAVIENRVWRFFPRPREPPDELSDAIRILADEFEELYCERFPALVAKIHGLRIETQDVADVLKKITRHLFGSIDNRVVKWGHVIALLVFAGILSVRCIELDKSERVDEIVNWIVEFLVTELGDWFHRHGGWCGYLVWFRASRNTTRGLRTTFRVSGIVIGVVITAIVICRVIKAR